MTDQKFDGEAIKGQYQQKLEHLTNGIEQLSESLGYREEMEDARQRMINAKEGKRSIVNPTWEYEQDDEYVDALVDFNKARDSLMLLRDKSQIQEVTDNLEEAKQQKQNINDKLEELEDE